MTDPLGQSQVLPYLKLLSENNFAFTLISCEKKEAFDKFRSKIEALCKESNINWVPIRYTKKPPVLSTLWDTIKIYRKARKLHRHYNFSLVHCRSYISTLVGLRLKRRHGVKFIFDMRGLWADERVDGNLWNLSNPVMKIVYGYFKKKERSFLIESDAVVSLTNAAKKEILSWEIPQLNEEKIQVIPCSADFDLFPFQCTESKKNARTKLKIAPGIFLLLYIGSLGTWYLLEDMLRFFSLLKKELGDARFLILTKDEDKIGKNMLSKYDLAKEDLIVRFARREEIPHLALAANFSIFFIKQSYSKISSCPTKMGELLAMGIPLICNNKVGDVEEIISETSSGVCIDDFSEESFRNAILQIKNWQISKSSNIREKARPIFALGNGANAYLEIYIQLLQG